MSSYCEYIAVFKTALISAAPPKIVSRPVKIEFFKGPRTIFVPPRDIKIIEPKPNFSPDTIFPQEGFSIPLHPGVKLLLSENSGPYLLISVRTKEEEEGYKSTQFCNNHLDSTIAYMSFLYSPSLFAIQIYRGRVLQENEPYMEFMLLFEDPLSIPDDLADSITAGRLELNKDPDHYSRYLLMARFYAKSTFIVPCEEKFIYLWTILEIFPMQDTSNIRSIHDYLGIYMQKDSALVKDRLGIGKLYSHRCDLLHDGKLNILGEDQHEIFKRLELICLQVLRSLNGLPYADALESYFS